VSDALLHLALALFLVVGGYGFGRVAAFLIRNPGDWWHPEKWRADPLLAVFLVPTFAGRTLLGLGEPGRAGTLFEAAMAGLVSLALFAATGAALI
jgi:hypothetical protein